MNSIISKQLNQLKVAKIDRQDENNNTFYFKKINNNKIKIDSCYLIKLPKALRDVSICDSFLYNLNKGNLPKHEFMKIDVIAFKSSYAQVNGVYYDNINNKNLSEVWSGWLPINQIDIVKEL